MAFSPSRSYRLRTAYFLLAASISANVLAYTPPATPGVEVPFDFTGPTAEPEAVLFYNTSCDSEYYSWRGSNMVCATGDPQNGFCTVWMVYYDTDVFDCQSGKVDPNPDPDPDPNPDPNDDTNLDNLTPISWLPTPLTTDLDDLHNDLGVVYDAILKGARQSFYTKTAIDMLDGQVFRGFTSLNASVNEVSSGVSYGTSVLRSDIQLADTHNQILLNNVIDAIEALSDGSGSETNPNYTSVLEVINANLRTISSSNSTLYSINGQMQGLMYMLPALNDEQKSILTQINESIKSLGGGEGGDNSAVVEQLVDANSNLTDIAVRMRDLENAIGKSEASIVDAIEKSGTGSGSDPDAITENGCETFVCSTNSPQCYIARKEWETRCKTLADETSAQNSIDSAQTSLEDFINSEDSDIKNLDAGTVDIKQFTEHYNSSNGVNFGGSDTCPPPYVVDAKITTFTLDLTPFCDLATVIKFFLIAFASVASGLMIVKYH